MPKPWLKRGFVVRRGNRSSSLAGRVLPRFDLAMRDGTTRTIDAFSGFGFVLIGIGVDVEVVRELLLHPLARKQGWRAIATGDDDGAVRQDLSVEVARIVGEELQRSIAAYRGQVLLVRPDRYVAIMGDPDTVRADFDILWHSFAARPDAGGS